jgi:hypothetical protein
MSSSPSPWVLPAVTAAALAAVLWTMSSSSSSSSSRGHRTADFFEPPPPPVPPATAPKKGAALDRATGGLGLDDVLEDVRDVAIPAQKAPSHQEPVPHTDEETRLIATNILARVNDATARDGAKWDLRLVAMDSVRKLVDSYKTLFYTLSFVAYSPRRNVAFKIVADVVVPVSNEMYVERVRQFSDSDDDGGPRGSRGPHTEATNSAWRPVIRPMSSF